MSLPIVFVHGSGAGGVAAWPAQSDADFGRDIRFVTRRGYGAGSTPVVTDFEADAAMVVEAVEDGAHVVAKSYGALSAIRAAALSPATVTSLVLFEPAAFSLVRGEPSVEAYISSLSVETRSESMNASDFLVELMTAMGVPDVRVPSTEDELIDAERWRLQRPPWDAKLDPDVFASVATLAVTGHSAPAYDAVVDRIAGLGGEKAEIEGFGHSVADSPEANDLIRRFIDRVEARVSG